MKIRDICERNNGKMNKKMTKHQKVTIKRTHTNVRILDRNPGAKISDI